MTSTLSAWRFDGVGGARVAEKILLDLQTEHLVTVDDAAVVFWDADARGPKTRQVATATGAGAVGGGFWGLLFGVVFYLPLLGTAVGAAEGSLTEVGIDDTFVEGVRDAVTPGTSALFVLTRGAVIDRLVDAFEGIDARLVETNLSHEEEAKLREVFGA